MTEPSTLSNEESQACDETQTIESNPTELISDNRSQSGDGGDQSNYQSNISIPLEKLSSAFGIFQRLRCRFEGCECQAFSAPSSSSWTPFDAFDDSGNDKIGERRRDDRNSNRARPPSSDQPNQPRTRRRCDSCRHAYILHVLDPRRDRGDLADGSDTSLEWSRIVELASLILYDNEAVPIRLKILLDNVLTFRVNERRHLGDCSPDEIDLLEPFHWTLEDYHRGYQIKDKAGQLIRRWRTCSSDEEEAVLEEFSKYESTRTIARDLMVADKFERGQEASHDNGSGGNVNRDREEKNRKVQHTKTTATSFAPAVLEGLALRVWARSAPETASAFSQLSFQNDYQPGSGQICSPSNSQVSPSSFSTSSSSISYRPKIENDSIPLSFAAHCRSASANGLFAPSMKLPADGGSTSMPLPPPQDEAEDLTVAAARLSPISAPATSYDDSKLIRKTRRTHPRMNGLGINGISTKRLQHPPAMRPKNQALGRTLLNQLGTNPVTGKRRVQCMVCMGTFCDKGALKIHFSAVHLKEMHKCTREGCDMVFSSRRSRNRHSANSNPKLHSSSASMALGSGMRVRGGSGMRSHNVLSTTTASLGFRVISPPAAAEEYERMMAEFRRKEHEKTRGARNSTMDVSEAESDVSSKMASHKSHLRDYDDEDSRPSSPLTILDEMRDPDDDRIDEKAISDEDDHGERRATFSSDKQEEEMANFQRSITPLSLMEKGTMDATVKSSSSRKRKSDRPIRLSTSAYEADPKGRESSLLMVDSKEHDSNVMHASDDDDDGECSTCNMADDADCEPLDFSKSESRTSSTHPIIPASVESIFANNLFMAGPSAWQRAAAALAFTSSTANLPSSNLFGQFNGVFGQNRNDNGSNKKSDDEHGDDAIQHPKLLAPPIGSTAFSVPNLQSSAASGLLTPNCISNSSSAKKSVSSSEPKTPSSSVRIPINEQNHRQCSACFKVFQNQFSVKTHYQNVHMKIQHKCTVSGCNAQFPSKRSRDRHSANQNLHRKLLSCSRGPTPVPLTPQGLVKKQLPPSSAASVLPAATTPEFGTPSNVGVFGANSPSFISPPPSAFPPTAAFVNQLIAAFAAFGKPPVGPAIAPGFPIPFVPMMAESSLQQRVASKSSEISSDQQQLFDKKNALKKESRRQGSGGTKEPYQEPVPPSKQQSFPHAPYLINFTNGTSGETKTTA